MDARTSDRRKPSEGDDDFVRGAREHNLKDVSLDIPRNALVVTIFVTFMVVSEYSTPRYSMGILHTG
jgi:hypothetical protein